MDPAGLARISTGPVTRYIEWACTKTVARIAALLDYVCV